MIAKFIRLMEKILFYLSNKCRKSYLQLKYPGLRIDGRTVIERGCKIVCVDGGKLEIIDSFISAGAYLFADSNGTLLLDHAYIGRYTHIASKMSVTIKFGAAVAEMAVIRDQDHVIRPDLTISREHVYQMAPIVIGEHAWIASKATILKGVTIGNHAVIAASAVVTKSVPPNELWGGIPAKFIKKTITGH